MWEDPIVKETRAAREELLERFNYDLDALCVYLEEVGSQSRKKAVILQPRRPAEAARRMSWQPTTLGRVARFDWPALREETPHVIVILRPAKRGRRISSYAALDETRFQHSPRILRSFAVLRRISLATLAQRLRQPQDAKVGEETLGVQRSR